jgi:hypothetical protein
LTPEPDHRGSSITQDTSGGAGMTNDTLYVDHFEIEADDAVALLEQALDKARLLEESGAQLLSLDVRFDRASEHVAQGIYALSVEAARTAGYESDEIADLALPDREL